VLEIELVDRSVFKVEPKLVDKPVVEDRPELVDTLEVIVAEAEPVGVFCVEAEGVFD